MTNYQVLPHGSIQCMHMADNTGSFSSSFYARHHINFCLIVTTTKMYGARKCYMECINGKLLHIWIRKVYRLISIEYQRLISESISIYIYVYIFEIVVSVKSMKYKHAPMTVFLFYVFLHKRAIKVSFNVVAQYTLNHLPGHTTRFNAGSRNTH